MKAYLVNPPSPKGVKMVREGRCMQRKGAWTAVWSPISLATIAAILEKDSWQVKLSDCVVEEIDFDNLGRLINEYKPDLLIINTATPSIECDLSVASLAKKIDPKIITLAFGIHVTALPGQSLKNAPDLDAVVRGEPEMTIKEIALCLKNNEDWQRVSGITYKKENKINHNPDRAWLDDMDKLPFPAWHLADVSKYTLPFKTKPFLLVDAGRGCPHACAFCSAGAFYGHEIRLRSVKNLVDEIEWVKDKFKVDEFLFWTESFTLKKDYAKSVCHEIIKRNLKIGFVCNSRVTGIDEELIKLLKDAGCWMIGYGVESGCQEILDRANKGITVDQIKDAVIKTKKAGLEVTAHVILGLPGETAETMKQTLKFCLDLPLDFAQFYCAVPFPGSKFYDEAIKNKWISKFSWPDFEQNFCVLDYGKLKAEEIMAFRAKAFRRFYLQPKIVIKTLARVRSLSEFINLFKMLKEFINWV